ncbi:MAG: hypothetical protein NVS2B16_18740 [Chloroflexota bacterium]
MALPFLRMTGGIVLAVLTYGATISHASQAPRHISPKYKVAHVKIVTDPSTIGAFRPKAVTVHRGQRVMFFNSTDAFHTVSSDDATSFDSQDIAANRTWTFTPRTAGVFRYTCKYHPNMHGSLIVKP